MHASHIVPTAEQWEQSGLVQAEMLEVIDRLIHEGIDWRVVLSGIVGATANVLMIRVGAPEVPNFFAKAAAQTLHMDPKYRD